MTMKNAKRMFLLTTVMLMMIFLTSCFTIDEVAQPATITTETSFLTKLMVSTSPDPTYGLTTDGKYGIVGVLVPDEWTVDSVYYEPGEPGDIGPNYCSFLAPGTPDSDPGTVDHWKDSLDVLYPAPTGTHWEIYQSATKDSTALDDGNVIVNILLTTGTTETSYNLSYFVTEASMDFTDPAYYSISLDNAVEVTSLTSIAAVQDTTGSGSDASVLVGQTVTVNGIVTAELKGEVSANGGISDYYFWIQDAAAPWSGIKVVYSGSLVAEGDSVMVTGTVKESYNQTQLDPVTDYIVHKSRCALPAPLVVTTGEVTSEQYEGCLVTVNDVTISETDIGSYGEWNVDDGSGAVKISTRAKYYYTPVLNASVKSITGIVIYDYGLHIIAPRLAYDIVEAGDFTRFQAIQQVRNSDLIKAFDDAVSDVSYFADPDNPENMEGDTVTITGVVTMPTGLSYAGDGIKFIVADPEGGPWSAILSYNEDSTAYPSLFEGDIIEMTGCIGEYTTAVANMTEFWITSPINITSIGQTLPPVDTIATGDLRLPVTAEQWGNVMVAVKDAIVTDVLDGGYENFKVDDGSGGVHVDDDSDSLAGYIDPPLGSVFESIKGWVYHHYGAYTDSTAYKLCPLYVEDLILGAGPPMLTNVGRNPGFPKSTDAVTVEVEVTTNDVVSSALVLYSVDGGAYQEVAMSSTDQTVFTGDIPVQADGAWVEYFLKVIDSKDQSSMMPSDTSLKKYGYSVIDGTISIADVQYSPWKIADSPFSGYDVELTGIVTADTAGMSSYLGLSVIQDASAPWSGIFLFGVSEVILRGDEIQVWGQVEDYNADYHYKFDNNTMILVDSIKILSHGNAEPAPISVTTDALPSTDVAGEMYEGVLVEVSDVQVSSINSYDWSIDDGSGACLLDDDFANMSAWFTALSVDTGLSSVRGIYTYSFGTYKISVRDMADVGPSVDIDREIITNPLQYKLSQNFPNPFNPETRIYFEIPKNEHVQIIVYNLLGYKVRTITNQPYTPGHYVLNWDGRNQAGQQVASGAYILRMKAGNYIDYKKMMLIR